MAVTPRTTIASWIVLGLATTVVAANAGKDAWIAFARGSDPKAVLRVRPSDPVALARVIDQRGQGGEAIVVTPAEEKRARLALARAPLSRTSLRLVGLAAAAREDIAAADDAMAFADRVSRRDLPTQFWLIERSVQKGDIPAALAHYHAVLSVSPRSRTLLFPILTAAIDQPTIRQALSPYIVRQTNWSVALLGTAAGTGNPRNVVLLLLPIASHLRDQSFRVTNALLVSRLIQTGDTPLARLFVRSVWPSLSRTVFTNFRVSDNTTDERLGAFAWRFGATTGIVAHPVGDGGIDINADTLADGVAASRIMPIAGGRSYLFSQRVRSNGATAMAATRWQGFCLSGDGNRTPIWSHTSATDAAGATDRAGIDVPAGCSAVEFVLSASGGDAQGGAGATIDALELSPVSK